MIEATRDISAKIEDIIKRVDNVGEVCRSRQGAGLDKDHYYEKEKAAVPTLVITTSEEQLLKLFQRASTPLGEAAAAQSAKIDLRFGDFFNITMDKFEHQHRQVESLAAATAVSQQLGCCRGCQPMTCRCCSCPLQTLPRSGGGLGGGLGGGRSTERTDAV